MSVFTPGVHTHPHATVDLLVVHETLTSTWQYHQQLSNVIRLWCH